MSGDARDYDLIVVGAGGAGLSAAATAAEAGARVLVLEAAARAGGSTALAGGVFYAAGTSCQREAGVDDPGPEAMYRYYMTLNQYRLEASVVHRLCLGAGRAFEWLRALGVEFRADDLYVAGVDKLRRGHRAAGGGAAIVAALEAACVARGVEVVTHARVEALLVEDGRIAGVIVDGAAVRAPAVVIASGGFGANPEQLAALYPDAARHGDLHWYIGAPTCRGDGLDLGRLAGAALTEPNRGLLLLTPGFTKDLESYLPGWLMLVNAAGRRIVDETIEYSVLNGIVNAQPRQECYALFDEAQRRSARTTASRPAPSWTADRLAESVADGTLLRADTLPALAAAIDVPAVALQTAVARYNFKLRCAGQHERRGAIPRRQARQALEEERAIVAVIARVAADEQDAQRGLGNHIGEVVRPIARVQHHRRAPISAAASARITASQQFGMRMPT